MFSVLVFTLHLITLHHLPADGHHWLGLNFLTCERWCHKLEKDNTSRVIDYANRFRILVPKTGGPVPQYVI